MIKGNDRKPFLVLFMAACIISSCMPAFAADEVAGPDMTDPPQAVEQEAEIENAEDETAGSTQEAVAEPETTPTDEKSFDASSRDELSYDPLYVIGHADSRYVSTENIEMSDFVNVVTAAKGVATYNQKAQKDFSVAEDNYIAGLNYEIPVYDVDHDSDYYVAVPDANLMNSSFRAYDLMLTYNNDYAECISGYHYKDGILYIPKSCIDRPSNSHDVPEGQLIAIQMNYAIGEDVDFGKTIPAQILNGDEPRDISVHCDNLFDLETLEFDTGVKGRKESDVSVFLNGQMIPINRDAWSYSRASGRLRIYACPGVVSDINVVFAGRTLKEKAGDTVENIADALIPGAYAATVSQSDMKYFRTESGQIVNLNIPVSRLFVGWRGYYDASVYHKGEGSDLMKGLKGWKSSVDYLYGGTTGIAGSGDGLSDKAIDSKTIPLWAISSYAIGADVALSSDAGEITADEKVRHVNSDGESYSSMTIYEWLLNYRDRLEKSKLTYGDHKGNGIGGSNNFAFSFPSSVNGSEDGLVSSGENRGRANESFRIESDEIGSDYYIAASCNHLDDAVESDGGSNSRIYVTCLGLGGDYAVLSFVQARSGQNACAIYKFRTAQAELSVRKKAAVTSVDYLTEVSVNYSLEGAEYTAYTDAACTQPAVDSSGAPAVFRTDAGGNTKTLTMDTGTYYVKETVASKGFLLDPAVHATVLNAGDVTVVDSDEMPALNGMFFILTKHSDNYGFARLIGAKYRLCYYNVDPATSDVSSLQPARSWVFETRKGTHLDEGSTVPVPCAMINFSEDEPISGDDFYMEGGVRQLPIGVYTLEETDAPKGLARNTAIHLGCIQQISNGKGTTPSIEGDEHLEVSYGKTMMMFDYEAEQMIRLRILKKDAETGKSEPQGHASLAGAVYRVSYYDHEQEEDEVIGTITTDDKGIGEVLIDSKGNDVSYQKPGTYYVQEIKASPGYVADPEIHEIKARLREKNTALFTYEVTSLESVHHTLIHKTDIVNGVKELEGATLQVMDTNENVIEEWISGKKPHDIIGLSDGNYTLREITAPDGYYNAEDVHFSVTGGKVKSNEKMNDMPVHIVETGDASDMALFAALMLISALGSLLMIKTLKN